MVRRQVVGRDPAERRERAGRGLLVEQIVAEEAVLEVQKTAFFLSNFSLRLSRVCLGKTIVSSMKRLWKRRFSHLVAGDAHHHNVRVQAV